MPITLDTAYEKLMPALKELHCLIACLKSNFEWLEYLKGVLLHKDSLPIILRAVLGATNHKLARFKIFLQSLNWLDLSFSPGTSAIMSPPDYLSRRASDDGMAGTHKLGICDVQKCML